MSSLGGDAGYCYSCLRDHSHKVKGVLREAIKQWRRTGKPTESVRRKVELAEEELTSAETEHIWNVHLEDEEENRRLKEIGVKISRIRKGLEKTRIGFPHEGIPVQGTVEDLEGAVKRIDAVLADVYEAMSRCRTCVPIEGLLKKLKTVQQAASNPGGESKRVKYNKGDSYFNDGGKSLKPTDLLKVYGPQHVAKGVERGLVEVDRVTGRSALPPHERPSFWGNVAGTIGASIGACVISPPWDMVLALIGGHMSTTLWDFGEEYLAPVAARARFRPPTPTPARARFTPTRPTPAPAVKGARFTLTR